MVDRSAGVDSSSFGAVGAVTCSTTLFGIVHDDLCSGKDLQFDYTSDPAIISDDNGGAYTNLGTFNWVPVSVVCVTGGQVRMVVGQTRPDASIGVDTIVCIDPVIPVCPMAVVVVVRPGSDSVQYDVACDGRAMAGA